MLQDVNRFKMFPETLVAHQGHSIVLTSVHGHLSRGIEGFYHHNTRFLSRLEFKVDGQTPCFVSANPVDTYSFVSYYLAPTSMYAPPRDRAPTTPRDPLDEINRRGLELQVNRFVGDGIHQDVYLTNHALQELTCVLSWELEADFADLTEALEEERMQRAGVSRTWDALDGSQRLTLRYEHPDLSHATQVDFPPLQGGPEIQDGQAVYRLTLQPQETLKLCMNVRPVFCGSACEPWYDCDSFDSRDTRWDRTREAWSRELTRLEASNPQVQAAWNRAVSDLSSLPLYDGKGPEILTPAAGIPLYQALFGRDSLTATWQSSLLSPRMLRGTLETIARHLGRRYDDRFDEQPGRVIHQLERNPLALLGLNPFLHYYGDYAGPGMFLTSIGWYFNLTGDREFVRSLRDPILRVLEWMDKDGDRDGDGFYEYDTKAGAWGTKNQGWKDSNEAILYPDGRCVDNPIAVVEIQGYYFVAKQVIGQTLLALGEVARGLELLRQAEDLKRRFNEAFWLPDRKFYALALDADKRPVETVASNFGHCLACGIVDQDKAAASAGRLMAPDMFTGWGIRTLSSEHPAYNPFAYHLGTVWPSENASIALGFKRYGLNPLVHDLAYGLFEATRLFYLDRLPEAMGGHARDRKHPHPGIYPQSCAPQAWSSSAVILLIQALLGLRSYAPLNAILVDPDLPEWLPEVTLHDVAVGDSRVSLRFRRDPSGHTDFSVLESQGHPRVLRQPPSNHLSAGLFDRLGDLVESLLPG